MKHETRSLILVFLSIFLFALSIGMKFNYIPLLCSLLCFITLIILIVSKHKKQIYTYPKNGDKIIFLSSDAPHKSTAYKGYTGIVEDSNSEGFVIRLNNGGSLICGISRKRYTKVYWKYTDGNVFDDITNKVNVSKFYHNK